MATNHDDGDAPRVSVTVLHGIMLLLHGKDIDPYRWWSPARRVHCARRARSYLLDLIGRPWAIALPWRSPEAVR